MPDHVGLQNQNILEMYSRKMLHAIEVLSIEEAEDTAKMLLSFITNLKNIRGFEIYDTFMSAGHMFLMQTEYRNRKEELENFYRRCEQCGTITQLFSVLTALHNSVLQNIQEERANDALRPMRLAKQYIQNHYKEQISLEEVSDEVGLSPGYFSTLFKKEEGVGFAKYLINVRIEQAKIMLRDSNRSVADFANKWDIMI